MTFSFHCQSCICAYSGGQRYVTQFGIVSVGLPPGHPEKPTITYSLLIAPPAAPFVERSANRAQQSSHQDEPGSRDSSVSSREYCGPQIFYSTRAAWLDQPRALPRDNVSIPDSRPSQSRPPPRPSRQIFRSSDRGACLGTQDRKLRSESSVLPPGIMDASRTPALLQHQTLMGFRQRPRQPIRLTPPESFYGCENQSWSFGPCIASGLP